MCVCELAVNNATLHRDMLSSLSPSLIHSLRYTHLLPWHGHVLKELDDGMWHELERAKVGTLVMAKLAAGHVAVVFDDDTDL